MKLKPYKEPPTRRIKRKFAFLPITLSSNDRIWLETYYSYEELFEWSIGGIFNDFWIEQYSSSSKEEMIYYLNLIKEGILDEINK